MARDQLIQMRRDTAANWTFVNPTLAAGEVGFETDTKKFKIGDGTTLWGSLPYSPIGVTYSSGTNAIVDRAGNVGAGVAGDLLYQSAANTTAKLNIGTTGQSLVVSGGLPVWSKLTASTDYFSSTTSAQLAGVLSTSLTGFSSGAVVVFSKSPEIETPVISSGGAQFKQSSGTYKTTLSASTTTADRTIAIPAVSDNLQTLLVTSDISNALFKSGSAALLTGITKLTTTSGDITLPDATSGVTLATTAIVNGYFKADGSVAMTGNLNIAGNSITTSGGTLTLPSSGTLTTVAAADSKYLSKVATGSQTMAGPIDMGTKAITNAGNITGQSIVANSGVTITSGSLAVTGLSGSTTGNVFALIDPDGILLTTPDVSLTSSLISGTLPLSKGGTNKSTAWTTNDFVRVNSTGTALTGQTGIAAGDITNPVAIRAGGLYSGASTTANANGISSFKVFVQSATPTGMSAGDLWFW